MLATLGSLLSHHNNYSASQKKIPRGFVTFFPKRLGIFSQFLHAYYTFLSMLDYKILLWRSYAILSATTQRIFTFH